MYTMYMNVDSYTESKIFENRVINKNVADDEISENQGI